eukprot:CAMPEP_0185849642 /NCGR_PEP_ID=MMETSP1354-20130828/4082_1 /TAXON_ID=708628 /ORGANISM="Erythrolobus madagascarensis, Strain CCMP3276" /LENGTH=219 /DNA_ID=CAMNT_0028550207 /DNA_START=36 /DNA_END=695 /DNA_ORIENTATION=-
MASRSGAISRKLQPLFAIKCAVFVFLVLGVTVVLAAPAPEGDTGNKASSSNADEDAAVLKAANAIDEALDGAGSGSAEDGKVGMDESKSGIEETEGEGSGFVKVKRHLVSSVHVRSPQERLDRHLKMFEHVPGVIQTLEKDLQDMTPYKRKVLVRRLRTIGQIWKKHEKELEERSKLDDTFRKRYEQLVPHLKHANVLSYEEDSALGLSAQSAEQLQQS